MTNNGGFLIAADAYIKARTDGLYDLKEAAQTFQKQKAYLGMELVPETRRLGMMNLMLHDIEGSLHLGNTLSSKGANMGKVDLVLTNPPFGTAKGGGVTRDDFTFPTNHKQLAFLQHIYRSLKVPLKAGAVFGRAAVVLPDNVLFEENAGTDIRRDLMDKCHLHTILKFNHFGHDQVVLHENEIRKEKGAFNIFKGKEERRTFMNELTSIIEGSNFILISCTIDKRHIERPDEHANPYHLALGFCMETLHAFLEEKGEQEKETHIVVESRGTKEDKELELEFRRVCDGSNQLGMNLPFKILFSDKKAMSSGLQLADLVARPIGLHTLRPKQKNQAFTVLEKKFYCKGGRNCVGQDFEGYGMKVYPTTKSEKPR